MKRLSLMSLLVPCVASSGCRDLDRFDTGETEAYCGTIVDSDFTRRGFAPGLGMRLTIDIEALYRHETPGTLSTDDVGGPCGAAPSFDRAPLEVTPELFADPLSLLQFGSTRDHNFVAWVDSTCQPSALAVVSLMHTGAVEVRLLRRNGVPDATLPVDETVVPQATLPGDFGVFQLERSDCLF